MKLDQALFAIRNNVADEINLSQENIDDKAILSLVEALNGNKSVRILLFRSVNANFLFVEFSLELAENVYS